MAKGRELVGRIKTTENTRKITRPMEMVATTTMKRAVDRVAAARPYATALTDVIANLYHPDLATSFPLLRQPAAERRVAVVLLTSNRGLAGAFNSNLIKEGNQLLARLEKSGAHVDLHVVGRKGIGFFRYIGRAMAVQRTDITDRPSASDAASLVDGLMAAFAAGELDAVYVVHSQFRSALSAPPASVRILPVTPPSKGAPRDYLLYPSAEDILSSLLPAYVRNAVYRALVETAAAEQAARRTAMKN